MPTSDINPPVPSSAQFQSQSQTQATPALGRCPLCNAPLQSPNECTMCDWVKDYDEQEMHMSRNPRDGIAAILSFLWPGAGHIYKGHTQLGAALVVGGLACVIWAVAFFMFLGFLFPPIYWLWVAIDAFFRKDLKYPQYSPA